ncbi:MAG: Maf family protein [Saccharospirillum sp.]
MPTPPPLLLASTSPYRARLLATLGIAFKQASPEADETPLPGESSEALALRLAQQKADSLTGRFPEHLIIGSDQTASLEDGSRLTKPGNPVNAIAQLSASSGQSVRFHTAVAFGGQNRATWCVITDVRFRSLTRTEIERYVNREQPLDCAGSFKVEGLGITLFESVRSDDPHALVGLPLISLASRLRALGWALP